MAIGSLLGVLHATGLWHGVGYWSALWTHVLLAALLAPLLVWHIVSRPGRPKAADLDCTGGWWSRQSWDAVPLAELLGSVDAPTLEVTSLTGYSRLFPARDVANLYLAIGYSGKPLRRGHGAPVRLAAPGRRGFWWVKWVTRIDPVDRPWWLQLPFPLE
ncbi:molybdopterin-dependent oxidoreductase [Candidatus Poriferisodalis sp.]|uniref:molybdopterin-dependent oxidoreductase n=1 Tax=Candidatus Poriferisodalis sp. TaxID=3101277 RepID=UPI003B51965E